MTKPHNPRPSSRQRRRWGPALAALLTLAGGLGTAAESRVELRDGSVITGELVGVGGGSYRIQSGTLGEVSIPESEVLAIRPAGAAAPTAAAPSGTGAAEAPAGFDLGSIRQQLVAQPQIMEAINRLQSDPEVQSVLSDPELVRRIMAGDLEAVRADPRFQKLLENPAIQAIVSQALGR